MGPKDARAAEANHKVYTRRLPPANSHTKSGAVLLRRLKPPKLSKCSFSTRDSFHDDQPRGLDAGRREKWPAASDTRVRSRQATGLCFAQSTLMLKSQGCHFYYSRPRLLSEVTSAHVSVGNFESRPYQQL